MKTKIVFIMLVLAMNNIAQELVPNGNFESYSICPAGQSTTTVCPSPSNVICNIAPWTMPDNGSGTSDYYNVCGLAGAGVPANTTGDQLAHSGNGYAGFALWQNGEEYKEYLQVKLLSPMVAGQTYFVSFYVSLAEYFSQVGISEIGMYISTNPPTGGAPGDAAISGGPYLSDLGITPQIKANSNIIDFTNWTCISGIYLAQGGEEYITLGNFTPSSNITLINGNVEIASTPAILPVAYYYLDDVSIVPYQAPTSVLPADTTVCANTFLIEATGDPQNQYLWNDGGQDDEMLVDSSGIYWVDVNPGSCKSFRDSIFLNFTSLVLDLGPDTSICEGQILNIMTGVTEVTYLWNTGDTQNSITVEDEGIYWLEIANDDCPVIRDSIIITKTTIPSPDLGEDQFKCADDTIKLIADYPNYSWSTGDTNSTISVSQSGVYWLEYSNGLCPSKKDSIMIYTYTASDHYFEMPNIFTPNKDDSFNSTFTFDIPNSDKIRNYSFIVLNRWGNMVYETSNLKEFWDGSDKDDLVTDGVYYWKMSYESSCYDSGLMKKHGNLQVVK